MEDYIDFYNKLRGTRLYEIIYICSFKHQALSWERACGELEVLFVFIFVAGTAVEGEMEENSVFSASSGVYQS